MARNFTNHYLTYGDDFNIYDGEPEEKEITKHEDAYYAAGGEGLVYGWFEEEYIDAIIADEFAMVEREVLREQEKAQALRHAAELDKEMSEEEHMRFVHEQRKEQHRFKGFQLVLDEFHNYVPKMLRARSMFLEHAGLPMSGKLMALEQKKLFYY